MNNLEKIYLPIASYNLAHYFSMGCICPTRYISNRNEDIQNQFDNLLLLCKTIFTDKTNCSLEIVLTKDELESIRRVESTNFFLLDIVLPISRVKRIFFQDEKQKIKTIGNINDGSAFIPDEIVAVDITSEYSNSAEILTIENTNDKKDWQSKIELYNKLLGGFALMRLGGKSWMNYSENYFYNLSLINNLVKDEVKETGYKFEKDYSWLIFELGKHSKLRSSIYSKVNYQTVESYAQEEGVKIERKLGIIQFDKIPTDKTTYLISILATYGGSGRKKIDDLIGDLTKNKFPKERKEGISLIFGINSGYNIFRNKYVISNFEVDIKFKLNSQLDYYTIESIYQYVFNNKKDNYSFFYLDSWCPKLSERSQNKDFETYRVLDKMVIYKKKVQIGSSEYLQELYQNISVNNLFEGITKIVNNWLPDFLKTEKTKEASSYFERNLKNDFELILKRVYEKVNKDIEREIKSDNEIVLLENIELKKNIERLQIKYDELLIVNENLLNELNNSSHEKFVDSSKEQIEDNLIENSKSKSFDVPVNKKNSVNEKNNTIDIGSLQGEMNFPESLAKDEKKDNNIEYSQKRVREKELLALGITKLRGEAKKVGIKGFNRFANNPNDKERLINLIIEKEFNF